jgi:hypothetical protein
MTRHGHGHGCRRRRRGFRGLRLPYRKPTLMCAGAARHKWVPAPARQASMPVCVRHFATYLHTYCPCPACLTGRSGCRCSDCADFNVCLKKKEKEARIKKRRSRSSWRVVNRSSKLTTGVCLNCPALPHLPASSAIDYCAADRALLQCCCHACMCARYARTRGGAEGGQCHQLQGGV